MGEGCPYSGRCFAGGEDAPSEGRKIRLATPPGGCKSGFKQAAASIQDHHYPHSQQSETTLRVRFLIRCKWRTTQKFNAPNRAASSGSVTCPTNISGDIVTDQIKRNSYQTHPDQTKNTRQHGVLFLRFVTIQCAPDHGSGNCLSRVAMLSSARHKWAGSTSRPRFPMQCRKSPFHSCSVVGYILL